jgi:hypothetical protein
MSRQDGSLIPNDATVSPELLEALVTQQDIKPSDICVVNDPDSGKPMITLRQPTSSEGKKFIGSIHC